MSITTRDIAAAVHRCAEAMRAAEDQLNTADGKLGDGDTGQTMRRLTDVLAQKADMAEEDVGTYLRQLGMAGTTATGSSLGTLVCVGLMAMGKALRGRTAVSPAELAEAIAAAQEAMLARGGAALGDKTALDLLQAVSDSLTRDPVDHAGLMKASEETLETFRSQPNRIGRARMFAERSVGLDDPGMLAFDHLVRAIVGSKGS